MMATRGARDRVELSVSAGRDESSGIVLAALGGAVLCDTGVLGEGQAEVLGILALGQLSRRCWFVSVCEGGGER